MRHAVLYLEAEQMNPFPDELIFAHVRVENNSMIVQLKNDFRYQSAKYGLITVPAGFVSDGASVPRIFWGLFPPFGEYFQAALIHDYLYTPANKTFSRAKSDKIFLEAMKQTKVSLITRQIIYRSVQFGGIIHFKGQIK